MAAVFVSEAVGAIKTKSGGSAGRRRRRDMRKEFLEEDDTLNKALMTEAGFAGH